MLVESVTLGAIGGAAGLALAMLLTRALPTFLPTDFPRIGDIAIDLRITALAALISLTAGVIFGLLPALQARRLNLVEGLVDDSSAAGQGFSRSKTARARAAIMAVQVAVACVLLVGASLLIQTFVAMLRVDRGYNASNVLTARLATPDGLFSNQRRSALVTDTLTRLRGTPGVTFAGVTNVLPLGRADALMAFTLPPRPGETERAQVQTSFRAISPGYFEAMGIRVLQGRAFDQRDTLTSMPMLIVNRTFAKRFLGENAVGRRLPGGSIRSRTGRWRQSLTRWMSTFLYGVQTRDLATFVAVPIVLLLVATVACFIPARRAARLDPLKVLRG